MQRILFQRLHTHLFLDPPHTRVPAHDCAAIQAAATARCAVVHDHGAQAAWHAAKSNRDGQDEGEAVEQADILEAGPIAEVAFVAHRSG